jgi:hypothetical protein
VNPVTYLRARNFDRWLAGWARHAARQVSAPRFRGHRHVLFALCDHFEPRWGRPPDDVARARVEAWRTRYPRLGDSYRDSQGRPPRHSFFFPGEEYAPAYLDALAEIARRGMGEVELHLHHDNDTAANLRATIVGYLGDLTRHGHLSRADGKPRYAFIHGNWCLANARRDGRWCGVDDELPLLFETGCYADFTFPAAPNESQPPIVNQIYWPTGDLSRRRAFDEGERARVGTRHDDRLLIVQGPLTFIPRIAARPVRIENGNLAVRDRVTPQRVRAWVRQNIHVAGRPDWVFVKVHTHGAPEAQGEYLLGEGARVLHDTLAALYNDGVRHSLHYVTAREMVNVIHAALDGKHGDPSAYYDYRLSPPPAAG